jgi:N-acetylneuraminic acid mutarotase
MGLAVLENQLYAVGGMDPVHGDETLASVERYDPQADRWTFVASLNTARKTRAIAFGGHIYAIGGLDKVHKRFKSVERFDPRLNQWTEVAPLPFLITSHCPNDVTADSQFIWLANNENGFLRYDPAQDTWQSVTDEAAQISKDNDCVILRHGKLISVGGRVGNVSKACVEQFDLIEKNRVQLPSMGTSRAFHAS